MTLIALSAGVGPAPALAEFGELYFSRKIPEEVVFRRESSGLFQIPIVNRYERFAGGKLERADFKNSEYAPGNGPAHARNFTNGSIPGGTMWMVFKLRTEGYFGSGIANHIAIAMRSWLNRSLVETGGSQTGRGLALFESSLGGVMVENFGPRTFALADLDDRELVLRDGVSYWFAIHVNQTGIAYSIYEESGALLVQHYWADPNPVTGQGYAFAVLCDNHPNANCDVSWGSPYWDQKFEVRFSDIAIGWF